VATNKRRQQNVVLALLGLVLVYLVARRHLISADKVILVAVLVPSVILHEVSHGAVAYLFGDDTAKRAGRLTLNPLPHIDPFGSIILPALLAFSGAPPFGYAKPVPVAVNRLRSPRNQSLLVSLVGPGVNTVLSVSAALAMRMWFSRQAIDRALQFQGPMLPRLLVAFGFINAILAAFNLIPIPPLDGSAVIERLLPRSAWPGYLRLRQYSMPVLFVVVLLRPELLDRVFRPALDLWARLL